MDKGGQKQSCPPKVTVFCGFQAWVDKRVDKERGKAGGVDGQDNTPLGVVHLSTLSCGRS